jgi:hypothetical protein
MDWNAVGFAVDVTQQALSDYGAMQSAQAGEEAYRISAASKRRQAREAKILTDYRIRLIHEAGAELLGEQEAETGKSGLAMTGTPLATLVADARQIELSAAIEKRAGEISAQNWLAAAAADEASAEAAKEAAESKKGGMMGGLLGGLAGLAIAGPIGGIVGYVGGSVAGGLS